MLGLVLGVLLAATPDGGVAVSVGEVGEVLPAEPAIAEPAVVAEADGAAGPAGPPVHLKGAAEAELGLLPSGAQENGLDVMLALRPVLGFSVGEAFAIELGPTFRLRLGDLAPANRPSDFGGVLRGADWDETSDFGQILQALTIATESSAFFLRAGVVRKKTLGLGHLVNRYSNQENPDYHPAGATAVLAVGPVRAELFASDVLAARLFAGALAWDLGRTFSSSTELWDRFGLGLEVAHDFGLAGLPFRVAPQVGRVSPPAVTLLGLDAWAVLLRSSSIRAMLLGGVGSRVNDTADLGFVAGGAVDATVSELGLSVKGELRKQAGGFRHGLFGPGYELSRYADTGFSGPSLAAAMLPNGFSVYGEARVAVGTAVAVDGAVEHFFFGRTDVDASATVTLLEQWVLVQARFTAVGVGQTPRYSVSGAVRARLFSSFYLTASGGTAFFPQLDGTLVRGVYASAGVGVDFER